MTPVATPGDISTSARRFLRSASGSIRFGPTLLMGLIGALPWTPADLLAQRLNREMRMDSLYESAKINPESDKAYLHVRSEVPNLKFESNRRIDRVRALSSGDWEVWLPAGTHLLKISAAGFQRLELPPMSFARKKSYELILSAVESRLEVDLVEILFDINEDSVYISYGSFAPVLSLGKAVPYKLARGEYTFRFEKPGFAELKRPIKVSEPAKVPVQLVRGRGSQALSFRLPAFLRLTSEPSGAEVVLDGQVLGTTPYQGDVTAGNHQLELRKPLYHADALQVQLEEGKTVNLSRVIRPRFGYLTVSSNAPGSVVFLDGKRLGEAPIVRREVASGQHELRVEAPLYHTFVDRFALRDAEVKTADATLKPAFGTLEVVSLPENGATVFVDGTMAGTTPFRNDRLASGKYILKVSKTLFGDNEQEVTIADSQVVKKTVTLTKNFGTLTVKAANSTIALDGKTVGANSYTARLAPGTYRVTASRQGPFKPVEREITIGIGEEREVDMDPGARMGGLSVKVEPFDAGDAEIFVNDVSRGKAPLALAIQVGDYGVTARKSGYLDARRDVSIAEGETQSLVLQMLTPEAARQQTRESWGRVKYISGAAAIVAGGTAVVFHLAANADYDKYTSATSSADASAYREDVARHDSMAKVALGIFGACAATAIVSWIVQMNY